MKDGSGSTSWTTLDTTPSGQRLPSDVTEVFWTQRTKVLVANVGRCTYWVVLGLRTRSWLRGTVAPSPPGTPDRGRHREGSGDTVTPRRGDPYRGRISVGTGPKLSPRPLSAGAHRLVWTGPVRNPSAGESDT